MDHCEQIFAFADELDNLVDRYREEWDLPIASVVGCLFCKAQLLVQEAADRQDELPPNED